MCVCYDLLFDGIDGVVCVEKLYLFLLFFFTLLFFSLFFGGG